MKELWTKNWKKALLWLCGYVSIIAYVIAGGYAIVKTNDKELHKTAKLIFVITLIFTAIEALISILSGIASLGANMGMAISWINFFVMLAKIGVYAAGLIMALFASPAGSGREQAPRAQSVAKSVSEEDKPAETPASEGDEDKTE